MIFFIIGILTTQAIDLLTDELDIELFFNVKDEQDIKNVITNLEFIKCSELSYGECEESILQYKKDQSYENTIKFLNETNNIQFEFTEYPYKGKLIGDLRGIVINNLIFLLTPINGEPRLIIVIFAWNDEDFNLDEVD